MELKYFSNSPHVKSGNNTKKIMLSVAIALMPACIVGCIYFGWKAAFIVALSVISACGTEFCYYLILKNPIKKIIKEFDYSSLVTGLLLGMLMNIAIEWYVPILSSVFAILIVKLFFGGTGKNVVNPAIAGRIFAFLSFGTMMTTWNMPFSYEVVEGGATVVQTMLKDKVFMVSNLDMFLGINMAGCIGETCKLALLVGAIFLIIRGIIDWKYPVIYVAVTGIMSVILNQFDFAFFLPSILSGGLIIGAFFMATDYTTSPNTTVGNIVYFTFLGLVTAILREATQIEVVSFVILLGNLIVPLIDKFIYPRPFGYKKEKKEAAK